MILAVNESRNAAAARYLPPRAAAVLRHSARARHAIRVLTLRGLGQLVPVSSFTGAQLAAQDLQSYVVGVPSAAEQGSAPTPAQVAAAIAQDVGAYCAQWADRCPGGPPDISSLIASYAAAYTSNVQRVQMGIQTGTIALPPQTGGGNATAYATPAIAPAPTYTGPIQPAGGGAPNPFNRGTQPIQWFNFELAQGRTPGAGGNVTGGGAGSPAAQTPTQAVLRNMSRPNMPLQVGDLFSLDIQGPANSPVTITATKNGGAPTNQAFGTTDLSGSRSITGGMTANEVGSWVELIQVGSGQPYTLQFNVSPLLTTAAGTKPAGGETGGGGGTATDAGTTASAGVAVQASGVPWGLIAVAVVAGMFLLGGRR